MTIAMLIVSIIMSILMACDIKRNQFKQRKKVMALALLLLILAIIKGGLL